MGKKRIPEEIFHVEVITKARLSKRGVWEYLVKWAGYDSDADTWEPEENVAGCQRLLGSFWKNVGMDDIDHPVGYEVEADKKWIKKEKAYFVKEFSHAREGLEQEKEEQAKKEKEQSKKAIKKIKRHSKDDDSLSFAMAKSDGNGKEKARQLLSSDTEDDKPLKIRLPVKRPRVSSDDDAPLLQSAARKMQKIDTKNPASGSKANSLPKEKGKQKAREELSAFQVSFPSSPNLPSTPLFSDASSPAISHLPLSAGPLPSKTGSTSTAGLSQVPDNALAAESSSTIPRKTNSLLSKTSSGQKAVGRPTSEVKGPEMILQNTSTGSGLSTKQRITQGALTPTQPKAVPLLLQKPLKPPMGKTNSGLTTLGFKKKPSVTTVNDSGNGSSHLEDVKSHDLRPQEPETSPLSPNTPIALQISPKVSATTPLFTDGLYTSPTSIHTMLEPMPPFENLEHYPETISPLTLLGHRDDFMAQADDFLSMMLPELADPSVPSTEENNYPIPPHPTMPVAIKSGAYKIPKKWKWSGQILIDVADGKTELLCDATLTDPTDHPPQGLRFSSVITPEKPIRLHNFYDVVDLDMFLLVCKSVEQLAKLGPLGDKDKDALRTLTSYLGKKQQVVLVPLSVDDSMVAFLLLFPATFGDICRRFEVPSNLQLDESMIAALIPWRLPPMYQSYEWRKQLSTRSTDNESVIEPTLDVDRWSRTLRAKSHYHHALRILRFPKWLHEFMSQANRAYCIWWESGDGTKKDYGLETALLLSVMDQCRAQNVGHKADVRAVFVHVGALKSLHRLPALVERRSKRPEVNFYTYGTHEDIPPERWGIHEIFPIGGIVTFTPSAFVEDPVGVFHRIMQIAKHPLWACYVLPSVFGMVAKTTSNGEDLMSLFDSGDFSYQYLLTAIEEGDVALMKAPPLRRNPLGENDHVQDWIGEQFAFISMQSREILEYCIKAFNERYTNIQTSEWSSGIESEISDDLSSMQMQPAIMENFRRFVVIKGTHDDHIAWNKDGFEWVSLSNFDFKDDFFPKQAQTVRPEETSTVDIRS